MGWKRALAGVIAAVLGSGVATWVVGGSAQAADWAPLATCPAATGTPCVIDVTVDGVAVPSGTGGGAGVSYEGYSEDGTTGNQQRLVFVTLEGTSLTSSDDVRISLRTNGFLNPTLTTTRSSTPVLPSVSGDVVTFSGRPVATAGQAGAVFTVVIDDAAFLGPAVLPKVDGSAWASNLGATSGLGEPPTCGRGTCSESVDFSGPPTEPDGSPAIGWMRYRLPYAALRDWWGIPDPSTMRPGSLVLRGQAHLALRADPNGGALLLDFSGIRFGPAAGDGAFADVQDVLTRGVIVPTAPGIVTGRRIATHAAVVRAGRASRPRGARVRGYRAACHAVGGSHAVAADSATRSVRVGGLARGVSYRCRERARSAAGPGPWSASVRVPPHP